MREESSWCVYHSVNREIFVDSSWHSGRKTMKWRGCVCTHTGAFSHGVCAFVVGCSIDSH